MGLGEERFLVNPYDLTAGSNKRVWWKCRVCRCRWRTSINNRTNLVNSTGCPSCNGYQLNSLVDLQDHARLRRGKCLSTKYYNSKSKYDWRCESSHDWSATWNSIRNGSWCPYCSGHFGHGIHDLKQYAASKGGHCLSSVYLGSRSSYLWKCEKAHRWESSWMSVKRGSWCPKCRGFNKTLLEANREIHVLGFKLIANEFLGTNFKYDFRCSKDHTWNAKFSLLRGCPYCAGQKPTPENNLLLKHPEVAAMLDPVQGIDPRTILPGSSLKYWWITPKGRRFSNVRNIVSSYGIREHDLQHRCRKIPHALHDSLATLSRKGHSSSYLAEWLGAYHGINVNRKTVYNLLRVII